MAFQLTTLGTIALRRPDGTSIESVLQQPRRLSLLVYLALASRDGMVRRDEVAALFWPDSDATASRNALSQGLHHLRKSLSADAIITRGNDEVALDPAVVVCDAVQLLHGLNAADAATTEVEKALDLYGGDFMPGLFDSGSAAFEQWVDRIRATIRREASDTAWARADRLADAGDNFGAATLARRAAGWMEADEVSLRALMNVLARIGDRAGALEAFDRFRHLLASEYEMDPSAETVALANSIREPDPVSSGDVTPPAPVYKDTITPAEVAAAVVLPTRRRRVPVWAERVATAVGTVVVAGVILVNWAARSNEVSADAAAISVMVSDIGADAADADLVAAGRQLRETLIHNLAGGNLPFPVLDGSVARDVDVKLGDHFQVVGGITREESTGTSRVMVRIVDRSNASVIDSREFSFGTDEFSDAGLAVGDYARRVIGAELDARRELEPDVRDAVIASRRARTQADSLVERDAADVALLKLRETDRTLAELRASDNATADVSAERAEIALSRFWASMLSGTPLSDTRAHITSGLAQVRLAEKLDRDHEKTDELAGLLYRWLWLSTPADSVNAPDNRQYRDLAIKHLSAAVEATPQRGRAWNALSGLYFEQGRYVEAYYAAEQALRADMYVRDANGIRLRLFMTAIETGDMKAAGGWCSEIGRSRGDNWWGPYCQLVLLAWKPEISAGDAERATTLLNVLTAQENPNNATARAAAGVVFARAGQVTEARRILDSLQDPGMLGVERLPYRAWLATVLGDKAEASRDLDAYVAGWPDARMGVLKSRRFDRAQGRTD